MNGKQLPRSLDTDTIANLAVTYTQAAFEKHGWLFRRQEGRTDFGIDAEIEVVERNLVTGHIFKGQVKGQSRTEWSDGATQVTVKTSTYNLWKAMPVPVIALLCDVRTHNVYWNLPLSQAPRKNAATLQLRFEIEQCLDTNFAGLEKLLRSWFGAFSENILREVPYFYTVFNRFRELAEFGDPWCMIQSEDDSNCRLFYRHLVQLRLHLGLSCDELPSIDDWYLRSYSMWHDDGALFYGTFEELVRYVEGDYDEAIRELKRRSASVEPCFENQELLHFFKRLDAKDGEPVTKIIYAGLDPRMRDKEFARNFNEKLRARNALRFPQTKQRGG